MLKAAAGVSQLIMFLTGVSHAYSQNTWNIADNQIDDISAVGRVLLADDPGAYAEAVKFLCEEKEENRLDQLRSHSSLHIAANIEWHLLTGPQNSLSKERSDDFVKYLESKFSAECPQWWKQTLRNSCNAKKQRLQKDNDAELLPQQEETPFDVVVSAGCKLTELNEDRVAGRIGWSDFSFSGAALVLAEEKVGVEQIALARSKEGEMYAGFSSITSGFAVICRFNNEGKIDWIQESWGHTIERSLGGVSGEAYYFEVLIAKEYICIFGKATRIASLEVYSKDTGQCVMRFSTGCFE